MDLASSRVDALAPPGTYLGSKPRAENIAELLQCPICLIERDRSPKRCTRLRHAAVVSVPPADPRCGATHSRLHPSARARAGGGARGRARRRAQRARSRGVRFIPVAISVFEARAYPCQRCRRSSVSRTPI